MRIKSILCTVDLSTASRQALRYALILAGNHDSTLRLLHVISPVISESYDFPVNTGTIIATLERQARRELTRLRKIAAGAGVQADTEVRIGIVQTEVIRAVQEFSADMVVMGRHSRGKLERWFLGSVAERLLRLLPVPALVVGEQPRRRLPGHEIRRIIVTTDFSEDSAYAVSYAAALARETNAAVTVLHVIPDPPSGVALPYRSVPEVEAEIGRVVPRAARRWCTIVTRVEAGVPYQKILETADKVRADLVVMNIHGKGMLERALAGSTAERVIRGARCPVLAIPPRKVQKQRRAS